MFKQGDVVIKYFDVYHNTSRVGLTFFDTSFFKQWVISYFNHEPITGSSFCISFDFVSTNNKKFDYHFRTLFKLVYLIPREFSIFEQLGQNLAVLEQVILQLNPISN